MAQNWIFKRYGMTLTLYLEILIKVTAHPLPTSPVYVKYHSKNRGKGRKYTLWTKILKTWCDMTLTLVLENLFKVNANLSPRYSMGEIGQREYQGKRIYDPNKYFLHNSNITITFETWF